MMAASCYQVMQIRLCGVMACKCLFYVVIGINTVCVIVAGSYPPGMGIVFYYVPESNMQIVSGWFIQRGVLI